MLSEFPDRTLTFSQCPSHKRQNAKEALNCEFYNYLAIVIKVYQCDYCVREDLFTI